MKVVKLKEIEEKFKKIIILEMGFSFIFAILGIILVFKSEMGLKISGTLIGIFFLLIGLIKIYTFINKSKIKIFKTDIIFGVLNILLGLFMILYPKTTVTILNIGFGICLLLEGISKFILFINLKSIKEECSKIFLVSSLLLIFLGVIIIIDPFSSMVIAKLVGIFIILYNVLNLNDLVLLRKRSKNILKLLK
jgi:uncharacterized membrane protein HdeD (DUF308 family)